MKKTLFRGAIILIVAMLVFSFSAALFAQAQQEMPPEYKEFSRAMRIEDLAARLKELERIKAAYPASQYLAMIDNVIIGTKIEMADDIDTVLALQKSALQSATGPERAFYYYSFCLEILEHEKLARFDKKKVTRAIEQYAKDALKLSADPEFLKTVPPQQLNYLKSSLPNLYVAMGRAYLNENNPEKALLALEDFKKNGGKPNAEYSYAQASAYAKLDKTKEALDGYFEAAVDNHGDAVDKAKEYWVKVYGSDQGFETRLEARQRELPFHPEPFKPQQEWKGKTVLAELFTGSECPPCVGADLGFDGLIDAYGSPYVAVLEYHLPIPRPDPIMNMATNSRAQRYNVNSTPTTFFDGTKVRGGGGNKQMAEGKFKEYAEEIHSRIYSEPKAKLKVSAKLKGDNVEVEFKADKEIPGADYSLVLVQKEVRYRGGNGIVFHKMVVRDFLALNAEAVKAKRAQFNIPKAEADAEKRLSDYEKERSFTFKERHSKIDRANLMVVFFLQDREGGEVFNAASAEVQK